MSSAPSLTVASILPHEGPMLLLDELLDHGPEHVTCGVTIRAGKMFCDGVNGVPAWVGIEYMAQTVCAYSGIDEVRAGMKPSIGLLLGSRRYQSQTPWFALGATLRVRADLLLRDENDLVAFQCTIHEGDRLLARGDVKALRPKNVLAVIRGERVKNAP
jgi:predicted hotdog family 3-hydroxylacyl-ACP dehydratase